MEDAIIKAIEAAAALTGIFMWMAQFVGLFDTMLGALFLVLFFAVAFDHTRNPKGADAKCEVCSILGWHIHGHRHENV